MRVVWAVLAMCGLWLAPLALAAQETPKPVSKKSGDGTAASRPGRLEIDDPVLPLVPKVARDASAQDKLEAMSLFAAGRLHEQRQELNDALRLYQRALRYDPDALIVLRQIVPLAFNLDRPDEAVRYAMKVVQLDPSDQVLLRRLGAHLTDRRDFQGALKLYERAIKAEGLEKKSASYVTLMAQMGDLYFMVENFPQAAVCFMTVEAALDDPDSYGLNDRMRTLLLGTASTTYERFGMAYLKAKKAELAIAAFQKADKASPNKGRLALHRAQIFMDTTEPAKALAELEVYFQHQLKNQGTEPYQLLARVLKDLDKQDELIERLEKLRADDPKNPGLAHYLAEQLRLAGKLDKAEPLYLEALKQVPLASGYEGLIAIYHKKKDPLAILKTLGDSIASGDEVLDRPELKAVLADKPLIEEILQAARKLNKEHAEQFTHSMRMAAAMVATEAKQFAACNEFFELALATKPDDLLKVYQQWGLSLFMSEQYADAAKVFRQAIDKKVNEPGDPTLLFHLAGALEMGGKTDEALKVARDAVLMVGARQVPLLHQRVAWVYYHARRYEEAIAAYEELIEKFKGTTTAKEARLILSNIYVLKKDLPKAESYLEQVLDEYPDDPSASNDLGYLWADQGKNLDRALKMVQLAVDSAPENAAYQDSLGWAFFKLGRFQEAEGPLKKAAAAEDPDAVIFDHLADCYQKLNQPEKALEYWKRALEAARKAKTPDPERKEQIEQKLRLHQKNGAQKGLKPANSQAP